MQLKAIIMALVGAAMVIDAADMGRSPIHATLERRQRDSQRQRDGRGRNDRNGGGGGGFTNNGFVNGGGGGRRQKKGSSRQKQQKQQKQQQQQQRQQQQQQQQQQAGQLQLLSRLVQKGSNQDGNQIPTDGQSPSKTSSDNFINFCGDTNQQLTNGAQKEGGSCNGIPMGQIPSKEKMISAVITSPNGQQKINALTDFNIEVQLSNLAAGSFTNAATTYYSAPQALNRQGIVIGHTHVTVQDTGCTLNPNQPLDPKKFAFFKGINDAGNGRGTLQAKVDGGLPDGNYRVCSMTSASNHQPVLMPVAQRGAQDDCIRFVVGDGADNRPECKNNNNNNNNNNKNNKNNNNGGGGGGGRSGGGRGDGQGQGGDRQKQRSGGGGGGLRASQANAVGGVAAPAITRSNDPNRPFSVLGSNFTTEEDAVRNACDFQRAACQQGIQQGVIKAQPQQCDTQHQQCVQ